MYIASRFRQDEWLKHIYLFNTFFLLFLLLLLTIDYLVNTTQGLEIGDNRKIRYIFGYSIYDYKGVKRLLL